MIDSHQHFWNYNPDRDVWITEEMSRIKTDFYPNFSQPIFQKFKINGCIAVQADSSEEETLFLLALAEQNDFIKGVVGWTDLQANDLEDRLNYFSQFEQLKGFRHVVQGEKDPEFLLKSTFIQGVKTLDAFDFKYDLLIYANQLPTSISFCSQLSNQQIVLDHLAKPPIKSKDIRFWKKWIKEFKPLQHVSAKISGLLTEADWKNWNEDELTEIIDVALEVFGPDRLMFGSDYPVVLVAGELEKWISVFSKSIENLTENEKKKIKISNCLAFYQTEI